MKKLLSLILAGLIVFSFAACGGDEKPEKTGKTEKTEDKPSFEELQAEYQKKTAEDLIKEYIKDEANPTDEELFNLAATGAYGTMNEQYVFEESITDEALKVFSDKKIQGAFAFTFSQELVKNEDAMVRAYAYNSLETYTPLDDETAENLFIEKIKEETDIKVIACALNGLKNALSERAEFADFAVEYTGHEDPVIRYLAATALGYYRLEDNEKYVDAMIPLMKDSDEEVAKTACKEIGGFGNEKAVAAITEILSDEALVNLHGSATESLEDLWMNFPLYDGVSEAAYRAHIAYLNSDSANPKIPSWTAVASMPNPGGKYEEWKSASTYFNTAEIVAALSKIVADADIEKLAKTTAIQKIGAFGTAADLEALKAVVGDDSSLISSIDSQLAKKQ